MEDVAMNNNRKAIEELVKGREFANQLRQSIYGYDESATATPFSQHLVRNVIRSFSNTLFLLNKYPTYQVSQMVSPAISDNSQESCKNRRCFPKRRRTTQSREKVSEAPTDDGHQWRKYGQKAILNSKYSRNYYRCTHKYDQGCQATKQVQQVQEELPLYRTTYYGHHTCRNLLNPEIILDSSSPSILLSFDNTFPTPTKQDCPFLFSSFPSPSEKIECNHKEEVPSSSTDDYLLSPEPTLDNSPGHVTLSSTLESDHRDDVMSGVLYGSVELDDGFLPFVGF